MPVRAITRNAGDTSATAIRMKIYGMPHITDISAKRTSGRLTTDGRAGASSADVLRTPAYASAGENAISSDRTSRRQR
jgi:hypothetical protein